MHGIFHGPLNANLAPTPPQATYEEAEANYLKAMELNPTFVDSSFALGELYQAMKRVEEAGQAPTPF